MRIGVFDSGLGGLTILKAICAELRPYDYVYYGDTANLPYGDKSEEEIEGLTRNAVHELFKRDAALVVVACNTASAETLRVLQDTMLVGEFSTRRILGVIIPTVEELLGEKTKSALIIGTSRTIHSGKYLSEISKRGDKENFLHSLPTPGLVPLIEARDFAGACSYLEHTLAPRVGEVDTLVLGCTHYTVMKDWLRARFPYLRILSQDEIIPRKLKSYLLRHPEIEKELSKGKTCEYIITGDSKNYLRRVREYTTS